ncbi:unnamed protein product [Blepharisma stoltei]|uniref:Uncharacterized protein n=1 Tax=Blepharisma stoltei TaxID=1481888 RepID=A0AAU9K8L8_9CILI|nr:unnamed protein product [Blepharisma stoltei]
MDNKEIDGEDLKRRLSEFIENQPLCSAPTSNINHMHPTLNSRLENHMDAHLNDLIRKNDEETKESPLPQRAKRSGEESHSVLTIESRRKLKKKINIDLEYSEHTWNLNIQIWSQSLAKTISYFGLNI